MTSAYLSAEMESIFEEMNVSKFRMLVPASSVQEKNFRLQHKPSRDELGAMKAKSLPDNPHFNSSLRTLCSSTHRPTKDQIQELQSMQSGCEATMRDLDFEIRRLQDEVNKLLQEAKKASCKHVNQRRRASLCAALLSPVRQLPPEILGEIFSYCVPEDPSSAEMNATHVSLVLPQICSAWRQVALGTPSLWVKSTLSFSKGKDTAENTNIIDNTTTFVFRDSALRPIPFTFTFKMKPRCAFYEHIVEAIDPNSAKLAVARRCEELNLHLDFISDFGGFLTLPSGQLKRLKYLELQIDKDYNNKTITIFESAPCLRKLVLSIGRPQSLPIPWERLTDLKIESIIDSSDLYSMLQKCKDLVCGEFVCIDDWPVGLPPGSDDIVMENLVVLKITVRESWQALLEGIEMPLIHSFHLTGGDFAMSDTVLTRLESLLDECRDLALVDVDISPSQLSSLLSHTPNLTCLKLALGSEFSDIGYECNTLFNDLYSYYQYPRTTITPRLEQLDMVVNAKNTSQFSAKEFLAMVESKDRLKKVSLLVSAVGDIGDDLQLRKDISYLFKLEDKKRGKAFGFKMDFGNYRA